MEELSNSTSPVMHLQFFSFLLKSFFNFEIAKTCLTLNEKPTVKYAECSGACEYIIHTHACT